MVWTFVVISILIFIFNFLGAFPLNKKSYLNKKKRKENAILKNYKYT